MEFASDGDQAVVDVDGESDLIGDQNSRGLPQGISYTGNYRNDDIEVSHEQKSLWQAFSEAQHGVVGLTAAEADMEINSGVVYFAQNPGQKLCARFMGDAVAISSGQLGEEWRVMFQSLNLPAVDGLTSRGSRVEYQRGKVTEWFENHTEGFEHGFIVREPLSSGNELRINVGVDGVTSENGTEGAITLRDESGTPLLSYSKLVVWDATGRHLPARIAPSPGGIDIVVGVEGAQYPITIDPLITSLVQKLGPEVTGEGQSDDTFGSAVAIKGNVALIGAGRANTARGSLSGVVYAFERSGITWTQTATLLGSDTLGNHRFGDALDLDGDRAIIGAWNVANRGAVYIFRRSGATWVQEKRLVPTRLTSSQFYGFSVALSGDHAVVGARGDNEAGGAAGKAFIYERVAADWVERATLFPDDLKSLDEFGRAVAIDNGTVVVGARRGNAFGVDSGSAYVFVRNGTAWVQEAELGPNDGAIADLFGSAVSVSGDWIVVGSPQDDDRGEDSGSVYVYHRKNGFWTQETKLVGSDSARLERFGSAVVIKGTTILVGAPWADFAVTVRGSAYIFERSGTTWLEKQKLESSRASGLRYFGTSVALDGTTALVGAGSFGGSPTQFPGNVHVFDQIGATWAETSIIGLTGDSAAGDRFGTSVAMNGDTAVIGAADDTTPVGAGAGTVYVLIRTNGTWLTQGRLAAGDAAANDGFGTSVSISGDTVVVGVPRDDVNETTYDSGSAYVFVRNSGIWSQQAKLLPADIESISYFGTSVAVDGDRLLVGSYWTDARRGAAYLFDRTGAIWRQTVKFSDRAGGSEDNYGFSVALSGDTALVGAPGADPKGSQSGAVFVHTRLPSGQWSERAVLSASDGAAFERFGHSLSLDGERVLIGGKNDSYLFSGVGSLWNEENKFVAGDVITAFGFGRTVALHGNIAVIGAPEDVLTGANRRSGSVYLFEENEGIWSQPTSLRSTDPGFLYRFGSALSLQGDTLIVGASGEDGFSLGGLPAKAQGRVYVYRVENAESKVSIGAEVLASPLVAGGPAAAMFRFTVTNLGVATSSAVFRIPGNTLPPGMNIVYAQPTSGFYSGENWSLILPPGGTASITLTLRAGPATASGNFSFSIDLLSVLPPGDPSDEPRASATGSVVSAAATGVQTVSFPTVQRQTGLLIGKVRIINNNTDAIPAFRLYVKGLPVEAIVRNAAGDGGPDSLPYLLNNRPLAPGQSVEFTVEIHIPNRSLNFAMDYEIELLAEVESIPEAGNAGDFPGRVVPLPDGLMMIEFNTQPGKTYQIEYSSDMSAWKVARGSITASSNRLQWIDNGPPKTETHPSETSKRLYRLAETDSSR